MLAWCLSLERMQRRSQLAPTSPTTYRLDKSFLAVGVLWLVAVVVGFTILWRYKTKTGPDDERPPLDWPQESRIARAADRATLVAFAHPGCACTRATISELARLMPLVRDKVAAQVVVVRPEGLAEDPEDSDLWTRAASIPGVSVARDEGGRDAARFRAMTSGLVVLYNAAGRRLFSGGITSSRAHEGDSFGRRRILAILSGEKADRDTSPVFGCALGTPESASEDARVSMEEQ